MTTMTDHRPTPESDTRLGSPAPTRSLQWWGGVGGIAFLVSLLFQNALRGAFVPLGSVSASDLRTYLVDHRWVIDTIDAAVAVNAVCLVLFVAAVYHATQDGRGAIWARVGLIGSAGIFGLFLMTVALESAMAARGDVLSDEMLETLWALHNAVFAMAVLAVATALLGFSLAAVAAGLVSRHFRVIGPLGAVLMIGSAAATVPMAEGSAVLAVAMTGFIGWLVFLPAAGLGLMRGAGAVDLSARRPAGA